MCDHGRQDPLVSAGQAAEVGQGAEENGPSLPEIEMEKMHCK